MNGDFNKVAGWASLLYNPDATKQRQEVILFNAPVGNINLYKRKFFTYVITEGELSLVFWLLYLYSRFTSSFPIDS